MREAEKLLPFACRWRRKTDASDRHTGKELTKRESKESSVMRFCHYMIGKMIDFFLALGQKRR